AQKCLGRLAMWASVHRKEHAVFGISWRCHHLAVLGGEDVVAGGADEGSTLPGNVTIAVEDVLAFAFVVAALSLCEFPGTCAGDGGGDIAVGGFDSRVEVGSDCELGGHGEVE